MIEKQMQFASMTAHLILQAQSFGYGVTLGEAWRSDETAKLDAQEGKGIAHSNHRIRLAIDLILIKDAAVLTHSEDYRRLGEWWEAQSDSGLTFAWGGRWGDGNHFSFEHEGVK